MARGAIDVDIGLDRVAEGLWLPRYRPGRSGAWAMDVVWLAGARGYWGDPVGIFESAVLSRITGDTRHTWMSIVPMEIESQRIGIAAARGHTVVLGLGMGWCAANVALNPAVTRVTVVERDPAVVALIAAQGIFAQLPADAQAKIVVVEGDALAWRPDAAVDSVQADIWEYMVEPGKWDDVHRIARNIAPAALYFWGQELELWRRVCRAHRGPPESFTPAMLETAVAETGLPLILDDAPGYADRIARAVAAWAPRELDWWR